MLPIARTLMALKDFDARRRGIPGEHLSTFAAGLAVLSSARRARSPLWRGLLLGASGLLMVRALAGRDGPLARMRRGRQPNRGQASR
jgi:hypothetical protein